MLDLNAKVIQIVLNSIMKVFEIKELKKNENFRIVNLKLLVN